MAKQIEYHWLITLSWNNGDAVTATTEGTIKISVESTRQQAVLDVISHARGTVGAPDKFSVLFLSLEPNAITPA